MCENGTISTNAMPRHRRSMACCVVWLFAGFVGVVSASAAGQQTAVDAAAAEPDSATTDPVDPERCFSVPLVVDMNVLSDQHLYVRMRDGHQYLLTTEMCANLERSYLRNSVRLVAYGRSLCQNDGSYLLYDTGGVERPCSILTVRPVEDRAEARAAAGESPPIEFHEVAPTEETP